jgi:hypothetical protein
MMRYGAVGLVLGLLVLGCGSDPAGGGGGAGATGQGGGGGAGGADGCNAEAAPEVTDVSGTWALRIVGSQLVQAPGFGEPFHTRVVSVLLVDQTQTGEDVSMSAAYCDHDSEEDEIAPVHAVIPDAFRDTLTPVMRSGTFAPGEGGLRYRLPRLVEVSGVTLADPATEALPTAPDDPRLVDQDMDGNPGVTIVLTELVDGAIYVVERRSTELDGVATSAERLEGLVAFTSEQSVVDSDPPSLKDTVGASEQLPDPEPCNSVFEMVRVPDTADCVWVRDQGATLFE